MQFKFYNENKEQIDLASEGVITIGKISSERDTESFRVMAITGRKYMTNLVDFAENWKEYI